MASNGDTLHFDIATPRQGPQTSSGRPLVLEGAGGNPVHGDVHMPAGAGGDLTQYRRAVGLPSSLAPGRDRPSCSEAVAHRRSVNVRSRCPRWPFNGKCLLGGNADKHVWMECTEDALRMQKRRFEEVVASYMRESKQVFESEQARWRQ